eukprot:TRINITY_DN108018_c0_g1_i1.p1 TRINITY_DN108018_c0_g1~~TRINITY_DN108018_c0_g1_i1.p1  ORF type:complete len:262 (+),score=19.34 TRINITY_DN108018_c0_g1_i1:107-892(+)
MKWWSQTRVNLCVRFGAALACLSWLGSYVIWLAQGCSAFLPFVSDFAGGLSGPLFMWGMTATAIALSPSWFDYYHATKEGLSSAHRFFACLHKSQAVVGVLCSISIAGVALNPWGERLSLHLFFANGVFNGGSLYLAIDSLLAYKRGQPFKLVLLMTCSAYMSLLAMLLFGSKGSSQIHADGDTITFAMIVSDFEGYCKQKKGSLHAYWSINMAAMFEWMLLASVTLTCFVRLHAGLREWQPSRSPNIDTGTNSLPMISHQ